MLRLKRLCALCLAGLALCALSLTAFAHPVPDLSKRGAITVTMRYNEQAVPGGALTLYRVGDVREEDGNYSFALTEEFAASGADLAGLDEEAADLARALADYAAAEKLEGRTQKIAEDGTAAFTDLEPGLYLLVQTEAAGGYNAASPFLVSVPMLEEDGYIYEVDAAPKVELTPAPTPTPTPTPDIPFIPIIPIIPFWPTPTPVPTPVVTPEVPAEPGVVVEIEPTPTPAVVPAEPVAPTLPQTGQLNWPVPVLAAAGLGLFAAGWVLRYGKKDDDAR